MQHIQGQTREQLTLLPEALDDYIAQDNPVRFLDAFVDALDVERLGFQHAVLKETGRPPYHPADLLKLYLYGYLNRIRSSRQLEREAGRNLELLWLLRRLAPDFKTIADFRKDNRQPTPLAATYAASSPCSAHSSISSAATWSPSTAPSSRSSIPSRHGAAPPATSPSASSKSRSRASTRRSISTSMSWTRPMKMTRAGRPAQRPKNCNRRLKR